MANQFHRGEIHPCAEIVVTLEAFCRLVTGEKERREQCKVRGEKR